MQGEQCGGQGGAKHAAEQAAQQAEQQQRIGDMQNEAGGVMAARIETEQGHIGQVGSAW